MQGKAVEGAIQRLGGGVLGKEAYDLRLEGDSGYSFITYNLAGRPPTCPAFVEVEGRYFEVHGSKGTKGEGLTEPRIDATSVRCVK